MRLVTKKGSNKVAVRYESGITKVAHAGAKIRIKNAKILEIGGNEQVCDDIWYFATDTFEEETEWVRIIQLSDEKVQLKNHPLKNPNTTEKLLKNIKKIIHSKNNKTKLAGIEIKALTKDGMRGCEKEALYKVSEGEKVFLGTPVNEKNMYALKYGQIRYAKATESCRVVCEAWINIHDIGFNTTTEEWEYLG